MMSATSECDSPEGGLFCELCNYIQFLNYSDWQTHHLLHLQEPVIRLVKLNKNLCARLLQGKSYKLNTGVARSSQHHVPSLKISIIKQGARAFTVKNQKSSSRSNSPKTEDRASESDSKDSLEENKIKIGKEGSTEVEGKDLLERLGASFSISRKGKASPPCAIKKSDSGDEASKISATNSDGKSGNILERLSGIEGISISTVGKSSNADSKPTSGVSISTKARSIKLSQLKTLKEQVTENEKRVFDKNKIFEKLSGSGILIAPKSGVKEEEKDCRRNSKTKDGEEESPKPELFDKSGPSSLRSSKSEDSSDSVDSKISVESRTSLVNAVEENGKTTNENSGGVEQRKFVRVKQSSFKKNMRQERQNSQDEASEDKMTAVGEEDKEKCRVPGETGVDILERLTENLNNTVGAEKTAENTNLPDSNSVALGDPLSVDADDERLNRDINAAESTCSNQSESGEMSESQFHTEEDKNLQDQDQVQGLLLSPPTSTGQDGQNSHFSTICQSQSEPYDESANVSEGNNRMNESTVSFTTLSNENQSEDQNEQQTAFWSDLQNSSSNADQQQEDPLLASENHVTNGDPNFLHNFSSEYQTPGGNIPAENSEFMSLDRLAQTQHQQSSYGAEPSSPMEHLNQQVQRIPNPTPQINVISQHHLQAPPPPPQPHTGVPLSPQHISPQQANSYDSLHMQPPLPPPLYQGYIYNQNYPPQPPMQRAPQPQMPMLQQRPHLPSRAFPPMSVPQQRPRPRPVVKRSPIRPPQELISPAKQARMNSPFQGRSQVPNTTTKLPSGITITPPKKTSEANKVANVLASRGITVTPSRQVNQSARAQQQRPQSGSSGLNISSSVSITSSNQNKSGGVFAVPSPRRSAPIVNHNAERPERCMTVDLTQDEDVPQSQARIRPTSGRFPCHICGKVFASSSALATHKMHHRSSMPFKCELCSAEFNSMTHLISHRQTCHKKAPAPDLAIPIVDLNHPGARDQLRKCGVYNFIPLAQLQSNNNGYFGVPIIQLDTAKEKAVSNLSLLGAGNILVLGKMKAIAAQMGH